MKNPFLKIKFEQNVYWPKFFGPDENIDFPDKSTTDNNNYFFLDNKIYSPDKKNIFSLIFCKRDKLYQLLPINSSCWCGGQLLMDFG